MQRHRSVRPDGGDTTPGADDTESMLGVVLAGLLEDSYELAAARSPRHKGDGAGDSTAGDSELDRTTRRRRRLSAGVGLLVVAVLIAAAVAQSVRAQPDITAEQQALVKRVQDQTATSDALSARQDQLSRTVEALRTAARTSGGVALATPGPGETLDSAGVAATGPGVVVTVDDAHPADLAGSTDPEGRILDIDLQYLVNGLWWAGAEAVAINGQRIGPTTAIRSAGQAITVDYRPLARPYVVTAIGDPKTLPARFLQSPGGDWMRNLESLHGIRFDVAGDERVSLPADTTTSVRYAQRLVPTPTPTPSAQPPPSRTARPQPDREPAGGTR